MADTVNFRGRAAKNDRRAWPGYAFIIWAIVISIGLIVATYALSVAPGVDPDQVLSIFAAP
jgi:hypothetical protein